MEPDEGQRNRPSGSKQPGGENRRWTNRRANGSEGVSLPGAEMNVKRQVETAGHRAAIVRRPSEEVPR